MGREGDLRLHEEFLMQLPLIEPPSNWKPPTELIDLRRFDRVAVDLETKDDGLNRGRGPGWAWWAGHVVGVAVATPLQAHYYSVERWGKGQLAAWLGTCFKSDTRFVFHNSPYDLGWLRTWELRPPPNIDDTMAMATMLNENRLSYKLDDLCREYQIKGKNEQLLREAAAAYGLKDVKSEMWKLPEKYVGEYAEQDAASTLELSTKMEPDLYDQRVFDAYRVEMDLVPMVIDMRKRGIRIDIDKALQTKKQFLVQRDDLLTELGRKLAHRVSIDDMLSPKSLEFLFDKEQIPYERTPKTRQGKFDSNWMESHPHWLPQMVARIRLVDSAANKFIQNYMIDFSSLGRIHAEIHSFRSDDGGTRSHRFAYSDPPLQQMPARVEEMKYAIRGCFLPEEGTLWFSPDYSQQEPRLTVHYAAELKLTGSEDAVRYYMDSDKADYHQMVADMAGIPRKQAKIINLGLAYGMGAAKLAASLGLSMDEAVRLLRQYHERVPFIKLLTDECATLAQTRGFIKLIDGARCRFDMWELAYGNKEYAALPWEKAVVSWKGKRIRRAFTHKAMNRLIQGSAARQTKAAMRECYRQGFLPLLQMHDEIPFPIERERDGQVVAEIMRNIVKLRVPVRVDEEYGTNWGNASKNYAQARALAA